MSKTYLSKEGYQKLKKELDFLKQEKRPEISKQIATARAHGDLKENAEYDAAREAQGHLEARIAEIETKLSTAVIVDNASIPTDAIYFGATVELLDIDFNRQITYTLVAEDEANFSQGKISISSPIGKGLLGYKEGDLVEITVPARTIKYKVLKISR